MTAAGNQRVAVVTGSSSGIGRAIALRLANDGFDVVVHARKNIDGANSLVSEIEAMGRRAIAIFQDFAETDSLGSFVQQCFDWSGSIHSWVNNAGADVLTGDARKQEFSERLNTVLQVDVVATLILSRLVGDSMKGTMSNANSESATSTIINIGWDQAGQGMAGESGEMFAASKGAIMACSKSLAQSLAPDVRVNCIAPGWIQTEWGEQASPEWQTRAKKECLLNRWGNPEDIASVASFLASDDSQFVNGQVINVNGGFRFGLS